MYWFFNIITDANLSFISAYRSERFWKKVFKKFNYKIRIGWEWTANLFDHAAIYTKEKLQSQMIEYFLQIQMVDKNPRLAKKSGKDISVLDAVQFDFTAANWVRMAREVNKEIVFGEMPSSRTESGNWEFNITLEGESYIGKSEISAEDAYRKAAQRIFEILMDANMIKEVVESKHN